MTKKEMNNVAASITLLLTSYAGGRIVGAAMEKKAKRIAESIALDEAVEMHKEVMTDASAATDIEKIKSRFNRACKKVAGRSMLAGIIAHALCGFLGTTLYIAIFMDDVKARFSK